MKKGVIVVVILCVAMISFNTGCTDKKPEHVDSVSPDSFVADSIKDSDSAVGTTISGLVGGAVVIVVCMGACYIFKFFRKKESGA